MNPIKQKKGIIMFTEQDLTKMCKEICAGVGYDFTIPVKINKRLKTTLNTLSYLRRKYLSYNRTN